MREGEIAGRIKSEWRKLGALVFSIAGSEFQQPGLPDCWVGHPIYTGWVEFKGADTVLRPVQKLLIEKIAIYSPVYVVRFKEKQHSISRTVRVDDELKVIEVGLVDYDKIKEGAELLLYKLGQLKNDLSLARTGN